MVCVPMGRDEAERDGSGLEQTGRREAGSRAGRHGTGRMTRDDAERDE